MKSSRTDADKQYVSRVELPPEQKAELVALLNQQLANLMDLYSQTKHSHWNVKGPNFYGTHKMFDALAETVEAHVDKVAERLTALGGVAHGSVRMAASGTELAEFPLDLSQTLDVIGFMAKQYSQAGNSARTAIDEADELEDAGTADMLTDVVRELDEALYFLDAHLQK